MDLKKYPCESINELKIHGRISNRKTQGIPLFWTGSAIEFNVTGSEIWLEYYCEYNSGESYIRVEIDGFDMYRFMLKEGTHKICIMRGFCIDDVKNICIYRETQASNTVILLNAIITDGIFKHLEKRKYRIEFYGDSVTSGEGLAGDKKLIHCIPAVFSCRNNYALLVANAFNADWSIVSQSGWGIYASWENNTTQAIPLCFDYVCKPAEHLSQVALGSQDYYDFENNKNDIAIINLGSNDASAFEHDAWIDENGKVHQLKVLKNGENDPDDSMLIINSVYNFCAAIRSKNKDSIILCCFNMLNDRLNEEIQKGAERFATGNNDNKVFTVCIPRADLSMNGSRNHPGIEAHKLYADAIINRLKEILKDK